MHAPCQFVPQAARRAKEAFFPGVATLKNIFFAPGCGRSRPHQLGGRHQAFRSPQPRFRPQKNRFSPVW